MTSPFLCFLVIHQSPVGVEHKAEYEDDCILTIDYYIHTYVYAIGTYANLL